MLGKPAGWAVCYSLLFKEFNKCMYIYIHTYIHIIEAKQQKQNFWQGIQDLPCNKPPFGGEFFHGSRIVSESSTLLYALSIIQRIERNKNKLDLCHHKSKPCTCILHRANMSTSALNQLSQTSDVLEWHCLEAAMASNRHVVDHVVTYYICIYIYIYIYTYPSKTLSKRMIHKWNVQEEADQPENDHEMTMILQSNTHWESHTSVPLHVRRSTWRRSVRSVRRSRRKWIKPLWASWWRVERLSWRQQLVGGLEHFLFCHIINNPNWLSYFSEGVGIPPTR